MSKKREIDVQPMVLAGDVDYALLFDFAPVGYLVLVDEGQIIAANYAAASMLCVDRDKLQDGCSFADFLHEDGLSAWKEHRKYLLDRGEKHSADLVLKRSDHSVFSVRVECVPQMKQGREVCSCLMVMVDISDRVEALQASEEKYRHLVEYTNDVPCKLTSTGIIMYVGPQVARYGFDPEKVLNTNFVRYIHSEDQERVSADFFYAVAENVSISSEFRVITPAGGIVWFEYRSVLFIDGPDGLPELNIILRDITERKKIDAAREWMDHQRRIALDAARLGWWHVDLQTSVPTYDERYREIFGITEEDQKHGELLDRVHLEDRERVMEQMKTALNPALPKSRGVEYRIVRPDGEVRWVEAYGMTEFKGVGSDRYAVSVVGTVADVTEQKQMREALEKKVLVLTQPLENKEIIAFEDLLDLGQIQKIQDEFAAAVGVASVITRLDGTPITRPSNDSVFCEKMVRGTEKGFSSCIRSSAVIGEGDQQVAEIRTCLSAGLWNAGACIVVGGRRIANWLVGQVRNETQSEESVRVYARELEVDEDAFVEAFYRIPEMSQERFGNVAKALNTMANQISTAAYQNILQARFITAQEKTKKDLRDSEERYRGLFETVSDAIIVFDGESRLFVDVNDAALNLYGYTHEKLFSLSRDALSADSEMDDHVNGDDKNIIPISNQFHKKSNRSIFPVEISRCSFSRGNRVLVCELVRDISGRLSRDQEIQNSREELRRLASELSLAEQRERQRVADALHDSVGQLLSSAYLRVGALCQNDLPESIREPMETVGEILGQSLSETRSLTFDLSCPALNELGLAAALKELCRTMSSGYGIVFEFSGDAYWISLVMDLKIVLYRAVRELLMNIIRHSGARKAKVLLDCADGNLQVLVEDNGKGFDDSKAGLGFSPSGGYGLFSIRESIRHVGGLMKVTSVPKTGTRVQITVPMSKK